MFNRLKFSDYNQGQYFEFLRHISAFRKKINLEIDYLEQLLYNHAEMVLQKSDESKKIIDLTYIYHDNINDDKCLDLISSNVSKEFNYKEKLILKEKRLIDIAVPVQRLNGLVRTFKYYIKQIFSQKQTFDLSLKEQLSGELWKYQNVAKDAKGLVATKLTPKQFFADNFLCLKQSYLTGLYICNTFEGTTNFGDKVDCQKEEFDMIFRIHEGYNTNQNLYEQGITLKFQQGVAYKNSCFQIKLDECVMLRPGLIYTVTLQPKNKTVTLFNLQGKGKESVDSIRFLNKEANMNYFSSGLGELKTYTTYSPLPALIVQA